MKRSKHWLWFVFVPLLFLGFNRLQLGTDVLDLLPPHLSSVQGLKLFQQHFADSRELILTLKGSDSEMVEAEAKALADHLSHAPQLIASVLWQPPWMGDPAQLGEILSFIRLNQSPEVFGTLTNRLAPEKLNQVLTNTLEVLSTSLSPLEVARNSFDPYGLISLSESNGSGGISFDNPQAMFASSDGTLRVLYVESAVDLTSYSACHKWLEQVKAEIDQWSRSRPNSSKVTLKYTGRPVFVSEIAHSMQRDMSGSVIGTAVVIAFLFWLAHRRWLPMIWLLLLLALILAGTLALGGLVLGTISVVSMGFAAILLGLAVDYALVHYQEALAHPLATVPEIRRAIAPSIVWAAVTTISAFLVLNLGGLPGLAQLGTLVALGVALSAVVMVWAYLPPLFRDRIQKSANAFGPSLPVQNDPHPESKGNFPAKPPLLHLKLAVTVLIPILGFSILAFKPPHLDKTANALRPAHSAAEEALSEMQAALGIPADPLWIMVSGQSESEVYTRLQAAEGFLDKARAQSVIGEYLLPSLLWPRPENQSANRAAARILAANALVFRETAMQQGFTREALRLTETMLQTFSRAAATTNVLWPTNATSQWLFKKFVARSTNEWIVLGLVYPATNHVDYANQPMLLSDMPDSHIWLSGWQLLGAATFKVVQQNLAKVVLPMILLVLFSLWMAFHQWGEVLLGIAVLGMSLLCLSAIMSLAGWSWNLLNLMALPLILGTGIDYSIFMQLSLRRSRGDLEAAHQSVGRALMLCGATAVTGFGSLAWSGNLGMASLGKVCAVGIGINMLVAVILLPTWWAFLSKGRKKDLIPA